MSLKNPSPENYPMAEKGSDLKKTAKTILKFAIGLLLFFGIVALFSDLKDIDQLLKINWLMAWPVVSSPQTDRFSRSARQLNITEALTQL